jgi:hypothetical protein
LRLTADLYTILDSMLALVVFVFVLPVALIMDGKIGERKKLSKTGFGYQRFRIEKNSRAEEHPARRR